MRIAPKGRRVPTAIYPQATLLDLRGLDHVGHQVLLALSAEGCARALAMHTRGRGCRQAAAYVSGVVLAEPHPLRERPFAGLRQAHHVLDHVAEVWRAIRHHRGPEAEQLHDHGGRGASALRRVAQVRGVARDLDARLGLRAALERHLLFAQRCETRERACACGVWG